MPSVLLVEDHPAVAQIMSRLLRERAKVELWAVVETAEAALATLEKQSEEGNLPELALIDLSLPKMSGIELVDEVRRLYPHLPCLVVSAHHHINYAQQALDSGARGYVIKGDATAVIEAVSSVLKGKIYVSEEMRGVLMKK